ncbi:hypothetical protein [Sphingobacterium puteale]
MSRIADEKAKGESAFWIPFCLTIDNYGRLGFRACPAWVAESSEIHNV